MKLASETDLYERYPDLSRLAKALQRAKGEFALFFVECNVVTLRHELARSLTTRLQPLPIEEETPDFYDWYSGVFVFPADKNALQQAEQNTFQQLSGQGVHSGNRSSITEKKQWLHTLRSLLEEHTTPDSIRGTLLVNIAYLHNSLGNYEQALNHYQEAISIQQEIGDKAGLCPTLFNIGHIHAQNEEMQEAVSAWLSVYAIAKEIGEAQALAALEQLAPQIGLEGGLEGWEMLLKKFRE